MAAVQESTIDLELENSSINSDEDADRIRKMQGEGNITVNREEDMLTKLQEIRSVFDQGILGRMPPGNKKKTVPWLERLDITSDKKVEIVQSEVNNDIQREVNFYNIAIENVKKGLNRLKGMNQKLMRPNDYLVEMVKSDEVMQSVRSNLVRQQVKIQNFEEKKLRRDNKKFAKRVQTVKTLEKHKEKRRNLDAINKWKDEIKQKGENAADLSEFLRKDPGRAKKGGKGGKGFKDAPAGKLGRGGRGDRGGKKAAGAARGKKKISKRPGKTTRSNIKKKRGSRK